MHPVFVYYKDYKNLLFEKISSFVENKFDLENKLVWKKFKNQALILDKLYFSISLLFSINPFPYVTISSFFIFFSDIFS